MKNAFKNQLTHYLRHKAILTYTMNVGQPGRLGMVALAFNSSTKDFKASLFYTQSSRPDKATK